MHKSSFSPYPWWLSLPTLCSLSYQVLCSGSLLILLGDKPLCMTGSSLFPKGIIIYFPKTPLLPFDLPPTAPSTTCYRAFQRVVPDPLRQNLGSGPEILSVPCVISNKLPRRFCCTCKLKNHCIHVPQGSTSVNLPPHLTEVPTPPHG